MANSTPGNLPFGRYLATIGLFLALGVPMVAYLWETVHQMLSLHFDTQRLLISLPVLGLFVGLLRFISTLLSNDRTGVA